MKKSENQVFKTCTLDDVGHGNSITFFDTAKTNYNYHWGESDSVNQIIQQNESFESLNLLFLVSLLSPTTLVFCNDENFSKSLTKDIREKCNTATTPTILFPNLKYYIFLLKFSEQFIL